MWKVRVLVSLYELQILEKMLAVQYGTIYGTIYTNVLSQSPKNSGLSSQNSTIVAKNEKSAYRTLHVETKQIEVNNKDFGNMYV